MFLLNSHKITEAKIKRLISRTLKIATKRNVWEDKEKQIKKERKVKTKS